MIDLLEAAKQGRESERVQETGRPVFKIFAGLALLTLLVAGLALKFRPEPSTTKSIRFLGSVEFADKRKESREMIEFTFLSDSKIAYLEKKRVKWSDSDFEVLVEIPKQASSVAFSAVLDHPGYKRFELDSVQMVGDQVKFPSVSLIRKWRSKKRRRRRKKTTSTPTEPVVVTPSEAEQEHNEAIKASLNELERNTERP